MRQATSGAGYHESIFINCPFDGEYDRIFKAVVFAVFDCGFVCRCAMDIDDASQVRIEKIAQMIGECRYGIHDLSRIQLDAKTGFPRFNMPLELGIFLGAKKFGIKQQKDKVCLILDSEKFRYQSFVSDIAGQDIRAHRDEPEEAIKLVRNWLSTASRRKTIPGGQELCRRYKLFQQESPRLCLKMRWDLKELTYTDYSDLITEWLKAPQNNG